MVVRKINGSERFDAFLISAYCFHNRIEDVESERERVEKETDEDWGAFTEDGKLAARIINNKLILNIDGVNVCAGGIGAVSTLPEYRNEGAIRQIFSKLLPESFENGEVISTLFPFNHEFYRKQGYEVVMHKNEYEFSPGVLSEYKFNGKITRWNPGESVEDYLDIYTEFASKYNLSMHRDINHMMEHMKTERLYIDRIFSYILSQDGINIAYIIFQDIKSEPAAVLKVQEVAWVNREGFNAILAFLARFEADYGKIILPLPQGIDLLRIIRSKRAYEIHKRSCIDFMVRVINAKKLLEIIKKPADCDFVINIRDEIVLKNNGNWRVTVNSVEKADDSVTADIIVSEKALAQMAAGCINLDEAMLRRDVCINSKEEMLRNVFAEKKIFVSEFY